MTHDAWITKGGGKHCSRRCAAQSKTIMAIGSRQDVDQPNDHKVIVLANGHMTKVSSVDYTYLSTTAWAEKEGGYVRNRDSVSMHRVVLERKLGRKLRAGFLPDHKNRNPLDNRRANLWEASSSQNTQNRGVFKNSATGYKGVSQSKSGKYTAYVRRDGVLISIGPFGDVIECAYVRDQLAMQVHGDAVYLNFEY